MSGHHLYYSSDLDELNNLNDVSNYIANNINYDIDRGYQEPVKTHETGTGNCTSYTIAYMNALYLVTGEKSNAIFVEHSRSVVNGSFDANHCIIELSDGTQIEPQNGKIKHYEVLYRYSFNIVF